MTAPWFADFDESFWFAARRDFDPATEAEFIKRQLKLRRGQSILDAPCGQGRVSLPLARLGLTVTGVDLDAAFIRHAKSKFRREKLDGTFLACDLRQLEMRGLFHGACNWFGSFGYFSDVENAEVVRCMVRALRPGGRLLIEMPGREYVLRNFVEEHDLPEVTVTNRWDAETERVHGIWKSKRPGGKTRPSSIRLYTPRQVTLVMQDAGLESIELLDGATGDEYHRRAKRMVAVGQKSRG